MPLGVLLIAYLRTGGLSVSVEFGVMSVALAFGLTLATERAVRLDHATPASDTPGRAGIDGAVAALAVGSVGAIAAGMTILLEHGWLTIALALLCPAIAWIEVARPVPALRWTGAGIALVVAARLFLMPGVTDEPGTLPVLNWLLYAHGVPAAAFAATAWRLGRTRDDPVVVRLFEALAVLQGVATVLLLIHHAMNDGRVTGSIGGLAEQSLMTLAVLGSGLVLFRLARTRPGRVLDLAGAGLTGLGVGFVALAHLFALNPLFTGEPVGMSALSGLLALGYLVPAIALGAASFAVARVPFVAPMVTPMRSLAALTAGAWLTLQVRTLFHRPHLDAGGVVDAELWAYSAAWLVSGIVVLVAGVKLGSRPLRLASAAIVTLVVFKVFLIDMAELTGVLRALSFIGLGLVLVGLGAFYQRLLRTGRQQG